jgi:hypothetical protein
VAINRPPRGGRYGRDVEARLLSRPIGVHWMGFRSNTVDLQRAGWDLAVEHAMEDYGRDNMYRLLMRHDVMDLCALTSQTQIDALINGPMGEDLSRRPIFNIQRVFNKVEIYRTEEDFANFHQIDAKPRYTNDPIDNWDARNIFARIFNVDIGKRETIVIDEADMSVVDHLQAIKDLQSSKQKEIRERLVRAAERGSNEEQPETKVIANLITFPGAA